MRATEPSGSTCVLVASGPVSAAVMVFGESPFVQRDALVSRPGPGELLLRRALADAGIEPATVRLLSAATSDAAAIDLPRPTGWVALLLDEVRRVQPRVLVLLGPSAGRMMLGARFAPRRQRGCLLLAPAGFALEGAPAVLVTAHPSTVHRSRHRAFDYTALVRDLRVAAVCLPPDGELDATGGVEVKRASATRAPSRGEHRDLHESADPTA